MDKRGANTPRKRSRVHDGIDYDKAWCTVGHTAESKVDLSYWSLWPLGVQDT